MTGPGALAVTGSVGVVFLPNANTYSGGTYLSGGNLLLGNAGALGSGIVSLAGGTLLGASALTIGNPLVLNGTTTLGGTNALTLAGTITQLTSSTLAVNNSTTVTGIIGESGGSTTLTQTGLGTLTLSNPNNFFTGGVTLNAAVTTAPLGTLVVGNPTTLGTGTLTLTAGNLQFGSAFTLNNSVTLNGGLVVLNGSNPIIFNGAGTLAAGTTTTLLANTATTFNGIIGGSGNVTLLGGNVTLTAANTYTGSTTVSGGTLTLSGVNGALASTTALNLNRGGTLLLDNSGSNNTNRVNDAGSVNLNGGTLNYVGSSSAASTETFGAVTLGAGASTIATANGSGQTAALTFASLTRANGSGGTINFSNVAGTSTGAALGSTSNQILFTSPPALLGTAQPGGTGLLPYATVNGSELATYATNGVVTYTGTGAAYATSVGAASPGSNVMVSASETVSASKTINSLTVTGNTTLTIAAGQTLTVTSGVVFVNGAFTLTVTGGGTLALGEAILDTASGASITLSAATTGNNLTLAGPGSVTLPSANTFGAGTTTLSGGVSLTLGTTTAIGTGTLNLINGSLQTSATGGVLLTNAVTFNNSTVTFAGSNPLLFSGAATLSGTNNTLTVTNSAQTVFDGVISGAGILTKAGTGTLVLSAANTYTGLTFINAGIIQVQNSAALGSVNAAAVVASGASVQVLGTGLTVAKPIILNGTGVNGTGALENLIGGSNTWSGAITLQTPSNIGADAGTTLTQTTGVISGPGDLTKVGVGTLVLNATNTYAGATNITAGVVNVQNSNGLGLSLGNSVVVNNGATLQLSANVGGKTLTLNGTGFGNVGALPQGALAGQANNAIWSGSITLNSGTAIGTLAGQTLTLTGVLSGTDLTKEGAGAVTLLAANTYTGNTTVNAGTLTLSNTNAYTGATTVSGAAIGGVFTGGTLVLNLFGTALNTSGYTINQNSTLTLDNTVVNLTDNGTTTFGRLGNSTSITLNTGTLQFLAMNIAGVASNQTVGAIILASGQSTIQTGFTAAAATGATSILTSTNLVRNLAGATVNFIGGTGNVTPLGTSTNKLIFTQINGGSPAAALVGSSTVAGHVGEGILPWAEVNGGSGTGDFATYSPVSGGTGIIAFSGYATSIAAATATDTVKLSAAATVSANQTINALLINGTAALTVTVNSGIVLTLSSGAFMANGTGGQVQVGTGTFTAGTAQGTLNFGAAEGIFFTNNSNANTNIDTFIAGSGGVTSSGVQQQTLNTGVSTYTGGTTLNSGTVIIPQSNGSFGTGPITLTGGSFNTGAVANTVFSNPINLNGFVTIANNAAFFTGAITLTNNAVLSPTVNVTFNGSIGESGGSHSLTVVGATASSVILNNVNTYTGGTVLDSTVGILQLGNNNALGTGTLTLVSGTLNTNIGITLPNAVVFPNTVGGGTTVTISSIAQGNNLTFAGPVSLVGSNTLAVSNTGLTAFTGVVSGSGGLTLNNAAGTVQFTGTSTFTGGLTITGGTLLVPNAGGLSTGPLILGGGSVIATAAVTLANPLLVTASSTLGGANALTFGGPTTLLASTTLTVNDAGGATLAGAITESGGPMALTVAGTGLLNLPNANVYSGGTTLSAVIGSSVGTLAVGTNTALGTGTLTLTAGVLQANTAVTLANAVALNSNNTPVAFTGSAITFTGAVTQSNAPLLLVRRSDHTTFAGGVSGNVSLTLSNIPLPFVGGTLTNTGNLILTSADSSSSTVVINGGTLTLSGANGAFTSLSGITLNTGGTLTLDNTGVNNNNRLPTSVPVTLGGGTLNLKGNNTTSSTQSIGAVTAAAGNSVIQIVNGTAASATL